MNAIIATTTIITNLITKDGITLKLFKGKIPKVGDKLYITGTKPYLIAKRGKSDMIFYTVLSLEDNSNFI